MATMIAFRIMFARKTSKANIEGVPVMALCGKVWIPNRDPNKYPVCKTCEEIMAVIRKAQKGGGS